MDNEFELQYCIKSYIYDKETNQLNGYNKNELKQILDYPNSNQKNFLEYHNLTAFKPDIYCQNTIKDLENNHDRQLEVAYKIIKMNQMNKENVHEDEITHLKM